MPNFIKLNNLRGAHVLQGFQNIMTLFKITKLDCFARVIYFARFNKHMNRGIGWLILLAASVQVLAEFLPFVSWIIWPFLVYLCAQSAKDQGGQNLQRMQYLLHALKSLKSKGEVLIALVLYGILSLILFRGLMEALSWMHFEWDELPNSVNTLLPFTLAEAFSVLFIATCAYRLNLDDRDPFKILSLSIMDLGLSPVSTLLILLFQCTVWTYLAMSMSLYFHSPLLSTFLGHAPLILFVLVWICGQPIELANQSLAESHK